MVCYCYYERVQNEKNRICFGSECACVTMQRDCGDFDLSDTKYLQKSNYSSHETPHHGHWTDKSDTGDILWQQLMFGAQKLMMVNNGNEVLGLILWLCFQCKNFDSLGWPSQAILAESDFVTLGSIYSNQCIVLERSAHLLWSPYLTLLRIQGKINYSGTIMFTSGITR